MMEFDDFEKNEKNKEKFVCDVMFFVTRIKSLS